MKSAFFGLILFNLLCAICGVKGIQPEKELLTIKMPKIQASKMCPIVCKCEKTGEKLSVLCERMSLVDVPLDFPSDANMIDMSSNSLTKIDGKSLSYVNNLTDLILSKNAIVSVSSDSLDGLLDLHTLDLSFNLISFIPSRVLHKLKELKILNLSYNQIRTISPGFFFSAAALTSLNLNNNFLYNLTADQFVYQHKLRHLDISSNKLEQINHDWFRMLIELRSLNLSGNHFAELQSWVFVKMTNLESLDLSSNNLPSLGNLCFQGLVNLKFLDLCRNQISNLPETVFSLTKNLEYLDLSFNPLTSLNDAFDNNNLLHLKLNNLTELKSISETSLDSLISLEDLSVSGNAKLRHIHVRAFSKLKNCEYLNLTHNKFPNLPKYFFDGLKSLKSISLFGNPWECDCRMIWLFDWLKSLPSPLVNFNQHGRTFCAKPSNLQKTTLLRALDVIPCKNVKILQTSKTTKYVVGSSALLECEFTGYPTPNVTWTAPSSLKYRGNETNVDNLGNKAELHVRVLNNGSLFITGLSRNDAGFYFCTASNVLNNVTRPIHLMLDSSFMIQIELMSLLVGLALSFGFLLITMLTVMIRAIARRLGWHCCCRTGSVSPKTKQIRKMLEYMEQYKEHQLEKLRENYTQQTQKIRDNCGQQMEKIRESYSQQVERVQNICDFGNQKIDKVRDNYNQQVQRVRDYSAGQLDKLRENYLYQRNKIRKFSAHHLYKLRENYKLQQQHLNKIIEHLNLDSCRTVCARTDSMIFDSELTMESVFRNHISFLPDQLEQLPSIRDPAADTLSQNSAYFTPNNSNSRAQTPSPQMELKSLSNEFSDFGENNHDNSESCLEISAAGSLENLAEELKCDDSIDNNGPELDVKV